MNSRLVLLLLCASLVPAVQSHAKDKLVLPDACGDDSIKFVVKTLKDQPAPAPPAAGKAQIVFSQVSMNPHACFATFKSCDATARFGVDGAWAGATRGISYFTVSVDPGVHHLCVVMDKNIGVESLTVEAGKVYYYQATLNVEGTQYGNSQHPNYQIKKSSGFSLLSEDEGKYRIKASDLATWETR